MGVVRGHAVQQDDLVARTSRLPTSTPHQGNRWLGAGVGILYPDGLSILTVAGRTDGCHSPARVWGAAEAGCVHA